MLSKNIDDIQLGAIFKKSDEPTKLPINENLLLKRKRNDLIEEYKILQNKIDTYGAVLIRFRGIMLSLVSAVIIFAYEMNFANMFFTKFLVVALLTYLLYYEFITEHARSIFQVRISSIERSLKNSTFLSKSDVYTIAENSLKIHAGFVYFITHLFTYKNWIQFVTRFSVVCLLSLIDFTKEDRDLPTSNINIQIKYDDFNQRRKIVKNEDNKLAMEVSAEIAKIKELTWSNNEMLFNLETSCYQTSEK